MPFFYFSYKTSDKKRASRDLFSHAAPKIYVKQQFRFSNDTKLLMNESNFSVGNYKGQCKIHNDFLQVSEGSQT